MRIASLEIKGITSNSRDVRKGFVFVAIKGNCQDGSNFIKEALANGASVVVMQKGKCKIRIPDRIKLLRVADCRRFLAQACAEFYGFPSNKLGVCGITGTNGKTTISYLIEAIAKQAGHNCGVIGTINYRFQDKIIEAKNTTPAPCQLQGLFAKMLALKVKYCAVEVSSHALDQERVLGVNFRSAIFTNLTQDHLDYHKNFENYFQAKAKLFRVLSASAVAIINNDDKYGRRIKQISQAKIMTYGIENKSTVMAKDINLGAQATEFTLLGPKINNKIRTNLIGRHNIYNILAAICWGITQGLNFRDIKSAIEKFKNVPGRLEKISCKKGYTVFVDYAHTPDALFNVLNTLRPIVKGKIIVIFGCGGQRDRLKRPKMGRVATSLADYAIINSDNPRSESPLRIIKDIEKGISKSKNNYCLIPQRSAAICKGISMLRKDDCLLVAGKGHENYQVLKNKILHFNDREEIKKCLASKR